MSRYLQDGPDDTPITNRGLLVLSAIALVVASALGVYALTQDRGEPAVNTSPDIMDNPAPHVAHRKDNDHAC